MFQGSFLEERGGTAWGEAVQEKVLRGSLQMSSDRGGDSQLRPRVLREAVRKCGKMKQAYCHQHLPPLLPDAFVRGQEDSEGLRGSHLQLPGGHCMEKMTCHKKDDLPTGSGSTPTPGHFCPSQRGDSAADLGSFPTRLQLPRPWSLRSKSEKNLLPQLMIHEQHLDGPA